MWHDRLVNACNIIDEWIKEDTTTPEGCIKILLENGLYLSNYEDARLFRKDLRMLRESYSLPYKIKNITIVQELNKRWFLRKSGQTL